MKPTPEQIHRLICKFQQPLTIRDGVLAVIDYWESIRPPCLDCGEAKNKAIPLHIPETPSIGAQTAAAFLADNAYLRNPLDDVAKVAAIIERETIGELSRLKSILADPNAVRLNMQRGTIAWTPETLRSVLSEPELTAEEMERAEFEAWAFTITGLRRDGPNYSCKKTEAVWSAWKAARAGR